MQFRLIAVLMIPTLLSAQVPVPASPVPPGSAAATQNSSPATAHTITVPSGTAIPLTLVNPIRSKSTKPGDQVRAVVAFPVTVGTELGIPSGTYVEGVIKLVKPRAAQTGQPDVEIHFTRLLFANGYSAILEAENTASLTAAPETAPGSVAPATYQAGDSTPANPPQGSFGLLAQQSPPTMPAPLPRLGPNPAVIGGISAGAVAAFIVGMLVLNHHRGANLDYVLYDAGWQFQMVLESPLSLDSTQVEAAASAPAAN